jgi:hypothetical protein
MLLVNRLPQSQLMPHELYGHQNPPQNVQELILIIYNLSKLIGVQLGLLHLLLLVLGVLSNHALTLTVLLSIVHLYQFILQSTFHHPISQQCTLL